MAPPARNRAGELFPTHKRCFSVLVYGSLLLQAVAAPARPGRGDRLQNAVAPEQLRSSHARSLHQYDEDMCESGLWVKWSCTSNPDNGFIATLVRDTYVNFGCPGEPVSSWRVPDLDTDQYFGCQNRQDVGFDNGYMLTCIHDHAHYLVYPHDLTCAVDSDGPYSLGCTCFEPPSDYGDYGSDSDSNFDSDTEEDAPCTAHTDCSDGQYCYTTGRHNAESGFCDSCLGCFKYMDAIDDHCPKCVSPDAVIDTNGTVTPSPPKLTSAPAQLEIGAMSEAQEEAATVQATKSIPVLIVAVLCLAAAALVALNNSRKRGRHDPAAQPAMELELETAAVKPLSRPRVPVREWEESDEDDEAAPLVKFAAPLRPKATLPDWGVSGRF